MYKKEKRQTRIKRKRIRIIIEKSSDSYTSYAENVPGVYGHASTVEQAKESALKGIDLLKKYNDPKRIPSILKGNYDIIFKFDTESFLNFYKKIFTHAAMERMTGINQKQLQHYSSGLKKPRTAQLKKIENAMHDLGKELIAIEL